MAANKNLVMPEGVREILELKDVEEWTEADRRTLIEHYQAMREKFAKPPTAEELLKELEGMRLKE